MPEHLDVGTLLALRGNRRSRVAVGHLGVVFSVSRGVHGEFERLEAVVLREVGHEGTQRPWRRGRVCQNLGEVGSPWIAGRVGIGLGNGHRQRAGMEIVVGHSGLGFFLVALRVVEGCRAAVRGFVDGLDVKGGSG